MIFFSFLCQKYHQVGQVYMYYVYIALLCRIKPLSLVEIALVILREITS